MLSLTQQSPQCFELPLQTTREKLLLWLVDARRRDFELSVRMGPRGAVVRAAPAGDPSRWHAGWLIWEGRHFDSTGHYHPLGRLLQLEVREGSGLVLFCRRAAISAVDLPDWTPPQRGRLERGLIVYADRLKATLRKEFVRQSGGKNQEHREISPEVRARALEEKSIKDANPRLSYQQVANEMVRRKYNDVTRYTVENDYHLMNWPWERANKV